MLQLNWLRATHYLFLDIDSEYVAQQSSSWGFLFEKLPKNSSFFECLTFDSTSPESTITLTDNFVINLLYTYN